MKPSELQGIQLMGSRICHDLAAPLSALSMGVEMMSDQIDTLPPNQREIVSLLNQSLEAMKVKLEVFRCLVGHGAGDNRPHMADITPLLQRYWAGSRYHCTVDMATPLSGTPARMALGLILTGSEALPRGGNISAAINANGISITLQGATIDITRGLRQEDPLATPELTARTFIPWYTKALCEELNQPVTIKHTSPQEITLTIGKVV